MPLYEYQCSECGKRTEVLQRFDDAPLAACPACGGAVKKLISKPAFQFKGSGWYVTDYARKGRGGEADGAAGSDGAASAGSAAEVPAKSAEPAAAKESKAADGSAGKAAAKPEAKPAAKPATAGSSS